MKKLLLWIPSIPFLLTFGLILVVNHVFQVVCLKVFGYKAHKFSIDVLKFSIVNALRIIACKVKYIDQSNYKLDGKPKLIVSNHQGMFDIPAIGWKLRKLHPKYVAKKELAFGIPAVSYNIRNGGCTYIDRKKPKEALEKIKAFNNKAKENNWSIVLFAEGTRSKDGTMKPFKKKGFEQILNDFPDVEIIPVALQNFWILEKYKLKPMPFKINPKCKILPSIYTKGKSIDQIIKETESVIKANAEPKN